MASKPASILQRVLAAAALLAILLFALQLWYVRNAKIILKEFITEQSDGRIKLELSKLDINLFSKRLTINEATLSTADSLRDPISYHVRFNRLSLNVGSVWSLFFKKTLLLDSIKLYDPVIQVMQLRKDTTQLVSKDELSIPQEMGKFYNSMLTALDAFSVKRINVDNARISLINKMKPVLSCLCNDLFHAVTKQFSGNGLIKLYIIQADITKSTFTPVASMRHG